MVVTLRTAITGFHALTVGETRSYCFYLLLKDIEKMILRITGQWKNNVIDAFANSF